jgi:hypothetical protein
MTSGRFLLILVLTVLANGFLVLRVSGWGRVAEPFHHNIDLPLRDGDLVLRCGKGVVSDLFRNTSLNDRRFSHAGIFLQTKYGPSVVHISQDLPQGLKVQPVDEFCSTHIADYSGWVRTDLSDEQRDKLHALVMRELTQGRSFDELFSLDDNRKQYCTEWVREVFSAVTGDTTYFPVTEVDGFRYIAPDNLYVNDHCTLIRTFEP